MCFWACAERPGIAAIVKLCCNSLDFLDWGGESVFQEGVGVDRQRACVCAFAWKEAGFSPIWTIICASVCCLGYLPVGMLS